MPVAAQAAVVVGITDGDTFDLRAIRPGHVLRSTATVSVRLLEIDTPETVHPTEPVGCYGPEASSALTRLAPVGIRVWVLPDVQRRDPYNRRLLYLWAPRLAADTRFVNLSLVRSGYARARLLYEPNDRYIGLIRRAQARARSANRGLWGACPYFGAPLNRPGLGDEPGPTIGGVGGPGCDPSYPYSCIPSAPPDLDCGEIPETDFAVRSTDPHGFDSEGDGVGCET